MKNFIAGLQFLTRLHFMKENEWSAESFGRSVKYFPVIGAIIGGILAAIYFVGNKFLPIHLLSVILIVGEIILTGGLHCDGFMDTADGVFSGRSRERILEIMKDSRVGSNGVVAFVSLFFLKWSLYLDMNPRMMVIVLFCMPIVSRLAMVMAITLFPYARPEGIGKLFAQYANKNTLVIAVIWTICLLIKTGNVVIGAGLVSIALAYAFARYISNKLNGLTGDVYGATTELTEIFFLLGIIILTKI